MPNWELDDDCCCEGMFHTCGEPETPQEAFQRQLREKQEREQRQAEERKRQEAVEAFDAYLNRRLPGYAQFGHIQHYMVREQLYPRIKNLVDDLGARNVAAILVALIEKAERERR